jgi:hypothetical protein
MRIEAFIQRRANYYLLIFVILTISSFVFHKSYGDAGWLDFGVEYSVPSIFGYALLLLCALGFYRLMQLDQSFDAWVYAFGYFLADDMLTLHETSGWLLSKYNLLPDMAGLPSQNLGELAYLSAVGGVLGFIILKRFMSAEARTRVHFVTMVVLCIMFVILVMVLDAIRVYSANYGQDYAFAAGLIKDGAEMLFTIAVINMIDKVLCEGKQASVEVTA